MNCRHRDGVLLPKSLPCDKAWQCATCNRLHLEGAVPMDYEDVLIHAAEREIPISKISPEQVAAHERLQARLRELQSNVG